MMPGEDFDESRLVQPGEWDEVDDDDETVLAELDARMEADLAAIKEEVKQGRPSMRDLAFDQKKLTDSWTEFDDQLIQEGCMGGGRPSWEPPEEPAPEEPEVPVAEGTPLSWR